MKRLRHGEYVGGNAAARPQGGGKAQDAQLGISKELAHWRFKAWGTFEKGVAWHELQKRQ